MKKVSVLLCLLVFSSVFGVVEKPRCAVCGMTFESTAKTSFLATLDGKKVPLCSFHCAHRTHEKHHTATFDVVDFESGNVLKASDAFFFAKSKKILKELVFDMPPTVVAFENREAAASKQRKLGDGVVILGLEALEKQYE